MRKNKIVEPAEKTITDPKEIVRELLLMKDAEDIDPQNILTRIAASLVGEGIKGNIKVAEWLFETVKNSESADIYAGIPGNLLGRSFVDVYRDILARRHRFYDFKGGRGSLKSSFCALILVDEIMRNPQKCAVAMRQIKDTLRDSVYSQITWAISVLGLGDEFKCMLSPLLIERVKTKQTIYFRGCDDPVKIKSLRPPGDMYIGTVWFEEADQLEGEDAIRNIRQSLLRGGDDIIVLSSYNTPISRSHFLNRRIHGENALVHHSFYYDAPREWLGEPFFDEAENLKRTSDKAYRHEYLGEAVGEGGAIFENLSLRPLNEDEKTLITSGDYMLYGVDFGYFPDPWAYVSCRFDTKTRKLIIADEAVMYKKSNAETAAFLRSDKRLTKNERVICDSAEPKSVAEYRDLGIYSVPASKTPGSVSYSIKWLQSLAEIVIDPAVTPVSAREFAEYEYRRDSHGEVISGYPDSDNHLIDAVRYACNLLWHK
ncbi:terminase large subunit [Clostridia bacterium]|nr:terminase large subunit [Clostridia bacterium]